MSSYEERRPCPVCLGISLNKMNVGENFNLDYCRRCGGFWFEKGEVQKLQNYRPKSLLRRIELAKAVYMMNCHSCHKLIERNVEKCPSCSTPNTLDCPGCGKKMKAVTYNNMKLDACNNCKSVWFDEIELSELWNMNFDELVQKRNLGMIAPAALDEGVELFLDVMMWNPGLIAQGTEVIMGAGGRLLDAAGSLENAPEIAGSVIEASGEFAGKIFGAIAQIIGDLLD